MSEACKVAGTASTGEGMAAAVLCAAPWLSASTGPLDDVLSDVSWEHLISGDPVDHGLHFASRQPIDGECGDVRLSNPRRLEVRSEGYEQQHAKRRYLVDDTTEQFEAGGVSPVCILKNNQPWILVRQGRYLGNERIERSLPTLLWRQLERRIPPVIGERQHVGKECGIVSRRRALRKQRIEFVEFRVRSVVQRKTSSTLEMADS